MLSFVTIIDDLDNLTPDLEMLLDHSWMAYFPSVLHNHPSIRGWLIFSMCFAIILACFIRFYALRGWLIFPACVAIIPLFIVKIFFSVYHHILSSALPNSYLEITLLQPSTPIILHLFYKYPFSHTTSPTNLCSKQGCFKCPLNPISFSIVCAFFVLFAMVCENGLDLVVLF